MQQGSGNGRCGRPGLSPVAVVVVVVVAAQGSQAAQADGIGEEDLRPSVYPHLGNTAQQKRGSQNG